MTKFIKKYVMINSIEGLWEIKEYPNHSHYYLEPW